MPISRDCCLDIRRTEMTAGLEKGKKATHFSVIYVCKVTQM